DCGSSATPGASAWPGLRSAFGQGVAILTLRQARPEAENQRKRRETGGTFQGRTSALQGAAMRLLWLREDDRHRRGSTPLLSLPSKGERQERFLTSRSRPLRDPRNVPPR